MVIALAALSLAGSYAFGQTSGAGQPAAPTGVRLALPRVVLGAPGGEASFAIQISEAGALPPRTYVRVRGLPETVTLSEGHQVTPGSWSVPLAGAADLRLSFGSGPGGKSDVSVALVSIDQGVIAEAKTMVVVAAAAVASAPESRAGAAVASGLAPSVEVLPRSLSTPAGREPTPIATPPADPSSDTQGSPRTLGSPATARSQPPPPPAAIAALPPSPLPPSPPRPSLSPSERGQAESYLARGLTKLREGDVASARLFFRRAADAGLGEAAVAMGHTYDPMELARLRAVSIAADPSEARRWYERASELGARAEAGPLLERLGR